MYDRPSQFQEPFAQTLSGRIEPIQAAGRMSLAEAQELHGLLNFATGYFAGRFLKYACFKIFSLVSIEAQRPRNLTTWCEEVLTLIRAAQPRTIPTAVDTRNVIIFTDGSWESGVAGIGACIFDETTGMRLVVQDQVPKDLLRLWKDLVGDHLICQIELYTMVLVRWEFQKLVVGRRVFLFVENNSSRGGVVKGRSNSPTMHDLIKACYSAEVNMPSYWWVEGVPSNSNPSDEPSGLEGQCCAKRWGADFRLGFSCGPDLVSWLVKAADRRR